MMAGPTMFDPKPDKGGACAARQATSKRFRSTRVQPVPPCSTGQFGAAQPRASRRCVQSVSSSRLTLAPRRTLSASVGGNCVRRKSANACCSMSCSLVSELRMMGVGGGRCFHRCRWPRCGLVDAGKSVEPGVGAVIESRAQASLDAL